jgi:hypothetical protein
MKLHLRAADAPFSSRINVKLNRAGPGGGITRRRA